MIVREFDLQLPMQPVTITTNVVSWLLGEVWAHKTSLTSPVFIEVSVPSQESERSCICVLVVSILSLSSILFLNFGTVPTVWHFFFSLYLHSDRQNDSRSNKTNGKENELEYNFLILWNI